MRGKQLPSSEKHEILRGLLEDYYYNHLSTYEFHAFLKKVIVFLS